MEFFMEHDPESKRVTVTLREPAEDMVMSMQLSPHAFSELRRLCGQRGTFSFRATTHGTDSEEA